MAGNRIATVLELSKSKPLPSPVLQPVEASADHFTMTRGIELADGVYWDPEALPNAHIVALGSSGSGKTQTLKAIAYELSRVYLDAQVIVIDFHGDQDLIGEARYALHQASPHGINPLKVNLDREGGGPALQAISVVNVCKRALMLGPNQEGALLGLVKQCYAARGIAKDDPETWDEEPPTFADLEQAIEEAIAAGNREAVKLKLKLAATVQYGIFSRPQPRFDERLVRLDVSKLPPELGAIAGESLARQLMAERRLMGEMVGKRPRTFLVIDEAKEMPATSGSACDRIIADGRKYGLALILASQSERHLSLDVIGNSSTKIVLPVDQTEVAKVARKFRFAEARVAALKPLTALCRFGARAAQVEIKPYWQRV
ncbi:MAG TPA: ATP-binding protein [Blastocatellia bacterium]|nr:ATP-binding protein [Blastocatellia bacterium]